MIEIVMYVLGIAVGFGGATLLHRRGWRNRAPCPPGRAKMAVHAPRMAAVLLAVLERERYDPEVRLKLGGILDEAEAVLKAAGVIE